MQSEVVRVIESVHEAMSLWAAYERGDAEEKVRIGPKGYDRSALELVGPTEAGQAHAYVSSVTGGHGLAGYALTYPALWWSLVKRRPACTFSALTFFREHYGRTKASEASARAECGYEGRDPEQVLRLFLTALERELDVNPLEIYAQQLAPCDADEAEAIARSVSEHVDLKYAGLKTF